MAERPSDVLNNQNEEVSEVEEVRLQPILRYKVFRGGALPLYTCLAEIKHRHCIFFFFSLSPPQHTHSASEFVSVL